MKLFTRKEGLSGGPTVQGHRDGDGEPPRLPTGEGSSLTCVSHQDRQDALTPASRNWVLPSGFKPLSSERRPTVLPVSEEGSDPAGPKHRSRGSIIWQAVKQSSTLYCVTSVNIIEPLKVH